MLKTKTILIAVQISAILCCAGLPFSVAAQATQEPSAAQDYPNIFITELQTSNENAAQEFIELYNASDVAVDLSDFLGGAWYLQYFSSTKAKAASFDWETAVPYGEDIELLGVINPGDYYVVSSLNYSPGDVASDQYKNLGFAEEGAVRLVWIDKTDGKTKTFDRIGWVKTGALDRMDFVAPHPAKGSLQRQANAGGSYSDTDNMLVPMLPMVSPTPDSAYLHVAADTSLDDVPEEPVDEPADEAPVPDTPEPVSVVPDQQVVVTEEAPPQVTTEAVPIAEQPQETQTVVLLPIQITELLPNPAPPATDSKDEFIELYNPNDEAVGLLGYRIESGSNNNYAYEFEEVTIPAKSYIVVTSASSPLSLANTGGHARLLDAAGVVISQTETYENAKDGMAWALLDGAWSWTDNPSPGLSNVLPTPVPVVAVAAATKAKITAPKKAATKKAAVKTTAAKKTTAKTAAAKTTKAATTKAAQPEVEDEPVEVMTVAPIHGGVLAAAGVIAVLYGAYEYRHDIGNRIHQLKRYRAHRREART